MTYRIDVNMIPDIEGIEKTWGWFMPSHSHAMNILIAYTFYESMLPGKGFTIERVAEGCEL